MLRRFIIVLLVPLLGAIFAIEFTIRIMLVPFSYIIRGTDVDPLVHRDYIAQLIFDYIEG